MASGYGFAGEGDWKTRRAGPRDEGHGPGSSGRHVVHGRLHLRLMAARPKSSARTCWRSAQPSRTANHRSRCIQLGIGGKGDPVRLVFTSPAGPAVVASIVDMGNRFRMIVNEIDVVLAQSTELPKLPVARTVWVPKPNLKIARGGVDLRWRRTPHRLLAGAHHGAHGRLRRDRRRIELVRIDAETRLHQLRRELTLERRRLQAPLTMNLSTEAFHAQTSYCRSSNNGISRAGSGHQGALGENQ